MPQLDGVTLLEIMRSYLRLQNLPVIVFTGLGGGPLVERAKSLNVNTVLTKGSAMFDEIARTIKRELRESHRQKN